MGSGTMILDFLQPNYKPTFSFFSCTFIKRLLTYSSLSDIRRISAYWDCWYFSSQSWFQFCDSSSPVFCMMYSACKLNKQGDRRQPWHTPFLILNQSIVLCLVLTVVSWPVYKFLRKWVRWSGISISLRIFHMCYSKDQALPNILWALQTCMLHWENLILQEILFKLYWKSRERSSSRLSVRTPLAILMCKFTTVEL